MLRGYDLFCGCGGLSLGLKSAGFKIIGAVDSDKIAVELYRKNVDNNCILRDVFNINLEKHSIDLLVAGLPCQGFSTIGKMDPNDPRNNLWKVFYALLIESRPSAFVVENVPFFLKTKHFKKFLSSIEKLGFFTNYGIINALNFAVPQIRKRAFFLGSIHNKPVLPEGNGEIKTVRDGIGDLPFEPDGKNGHISRQHSKKTLERFKYVPQGGNRFNLPDRLSNPCWRKLKNDGAESSFGRLSWNKPAHTIRTTFLQPECGRYIHPEADRGLTLREGARLQGFPDSYLLDAPIHPKSTSIGNAVPPPVAQAIGESMKDCL